MVLWYRNCVSRFRINYHNHYRALYGSLELYYNLINLYKQIYLKYNDNTFCGASFRMAAGQLRRDRRS